MEDIGKPKLFLATAGSDNYKVVDGKETSSERRKRLDHERYMREREMRLIKQRAYYKEHREQVRMKVRECQRNRWLREYESCYGKIERQEDRLSLALD